MLICKIAATSQRMREEHTQYPQKVNVWAGILGNHIIGLFFIEGNLNGDHYLALFQNDVIPILTVPDPAGWSTTTLPI